jgi:hypothetical protein
MTARMRTTRTTLAAAALLLVAGCASPDLSPVPTAAAAPYGCPGVPLAAAELITGEPLEVSVSSDAWGDETEPFLCSLVGEHSLVQVEEMPVTASPFGPTDEKVLASMAASSGDEPLELDAPGSGYVWGDVSAGWVCDGRSIVVSATGDTVEGRDRVADVTNLLQSVMPWACGDEDAPPATESD